MYTVAIIIYPKTMNWTYMRQRPQQLLTQLGAIGHQVFFENLAPLDRELVEAEPNVFLFTDHHAFVRQKLRHLRKSQPVIGWTTWARQRTRLASLYSPDAVIYDCCDEFPQWAKYEPKMVDAADHLVCTAENIRMRLSLAYPDKPLTLIPNGADEGFFNVPAAGRPHDLPSGKIVAYIGAWAYWLDHELMAKAAVAYPDVQFVSIGASYGDIPDYKRLSNVHILGEKPHQELKKYLQHIDVAIIPFQYHPITLATNPVKAYEYLAAGVPVLSTALPECIRMEPYVTTATTHADFMEKLGGMLSRPDDRVLREERVAFARVNRWLDRGEAAHNVITEVLKQKGL
ncbi:glycosyltransferase [Paenibacillus dokdonensis]|uniref:Glycosyltransferase n=1 Tax=Paenibacillus dokdonensis TaxID=2567944 RepID=A0ABU6GQY6_9BACL|nr:glycosyltransferase [Paenibacillus dokdonensis]MEC0241542.1 glycosyltransferase [Paenibacillus dokdonensis]